jgi:hypothetical protein
MLPFVRHMTRTVKVVGLGAQENWLNGGCTLTYLTSIPWPSPPIDVKRTRTRDRFLPPPKKSNINSRPRRKEQKNKV